MCWTWLPGTNDSINRNTKEKLTQGENKQPNQKKLDQWKLFTLKHKFLAATATRTMVITTEK